MTAVVVADPAPACVPQMIDLGMPAGALQSEVIALGPNEEAGGDAALRADVPLARALLWRGGETIDLGQGGVSDINARGDVLVSDPYTGSARVVSAAAMPHALAPLRDGDAVYARRLNDRGDVGGASYRPGDEVHAVPVVWRRGDEPERFAIPDGFTGAYVKGVDDAGDAVGGAYRADGTTVAAQWNRHHGVRVLTSAFGANSFDEANEVDVHGNVLGNTESFVEFAAEASLWRDGGRTGLGHLRDGVYSVGLGLNAHADAAGFDVTPDRPHAWVTHLGDGLLRLPALRGPAGASIAHAISEPTGGDVSVGGASETAGGESHATVWKCAFAQAAPAPAIAALRPRSRPPAGRRPALIGRRGSPTWSSAGSGIRSAWETQPAPPRASSSPRRGRRPHKAAAPPALALEP